MTELRRSLLAMGRIFYKNKDNVKAEKVFTEAKILNTNLRQGQPNNKWIAFDLIKSSRALANLFKATNRDSLAINNYLLSLNIAKEQLSQIPDDSQWQREVAFSQRLLGDMYLNQKDLESSTPLFEDSLLQMLSATNGSPGKLEWQSELSIAYWRLGGNRMRNQNPKEALPLYLRALDVNKILVSKRPEKIAWHRDLSVAYYRISQAFEAMGEIDKSMGNLQSSIEHLLWMKSAGLFKPGFERDIDFLKDTMHRLENTPN